MAGFSVFGQGTLLWQKAISIPKNQSLYTAAESSDNSFWVAAGSEYILGANNQPSGATAMVAFRANTGTPFGIEVLKATILMDTVCFGG